MLLAILFPAIKFETTLDKQRRALARVLVHDFSSAAPECDVDERRFINPLIALFDAVVDCEPDIRNGRAAGDVTQLRIAGQIADQDNAIKACHFGSLRWGAMLCAMYVW